MNKNNEITNELVSTMKQQIASQKMDSDSENTFIANSLISELKIVLSQDQFNAFLNILTEKQLRNAKNRLDDLNQNNMGWF